MEGLVISGPVKIIIGMVTLFVIYLVIMSLRSSRIIRINNVKVIVEDKFFYAFSSHHTRMNYNMQTGSRCGYRRNKRMYRVEVVSETDKKRRFIETMYEDKNESFNIGNYMVIRETVRESISGKLSVHVELLSMHDFVDLTKSNKVESIDTEFEAETTHSEKEILDAIHKAYKKYSKKNREEESKNFAPLIGAILLLGSLILAVMSNGYHII